MQHRWEAPNTQYLRTKPPAHAACDASHVGVGGVGLFRNMATHAARAAIRDALESNGVLGELRAALRAAVVRVVSDSDAPAKRASQLLQHEDGGFSRQRVCAPLRASLILAPIHLPQRALR